MKKSHIIKETIKILQRQLAKTLQEEQPQTVWNLKGDDVCWILTGKGEIKKYVASAKYFQVRRSKGDVFLTIEAAQNELKWREGVAQANKQGLI